MNNLMSDCLSHWSEIQLTTLSDHYILIIIPFIKHHSAVFTFFKVLLEVVIVIMVLVLILILSLSGILLHVRSLMHPYFIFIQFIDLALKL